MDDQKSWDIVVWSAENAIDYVPSIWAENSEKNNYKYPKTKNANKIIKLVDLCAPLEEDFEWLEATCKASCVKDKGLAKEMVEKGQYTSNFERSDDEIGGKKRRPKKKKRLCEFDSDASSDDDDETNVPIRDGENIFKKKRTPNPVFVRDSFKSILTIDKEMTANRSKSNNNSQGLLIGNEKGNTPKFAQAHSSLRFNTPEACSCSTEVNMFAKDIKEIKYHIKETNKVLERIETFMTNTNKCVNNDNEYSEYPLPCNTKEELEALDREISKDNPAMKKFVNILYLVGGSTPHKSVYLMMGKIFGKNLALKYSGQGKKKKFSFCELKIYEAVLVATRKRHTTVSEENIKKSIALYLATAKSRLPASKKPSETCTENPDELQDEEDF